jgi:hypothetical protein
MTSSFSEAYNDKMNKLREQYDNVNLIHLENDRLKEQLVGTNFKKEPELVWDIKRQICVNQESAKEIESMKHFYDYLFDIMPYIKRISTETSIDRDTPPDLKHQNECMKQQSITATSLVNITGRKGLGTLFADYMENVENIKLKNYKLTKTRNDFCKYCRGSDFIIFDKSATRVCQICGNSETFQREENNCFTFKDETENMTHLNQFAYKRSNHFLDWLNSLESKMVNDIPSEVLVSLRYELKKLRIQQLDDITPKLVRTLLKKQQLNKYYEHCNAITCELSGRKPLQLPEELKESLKKMFNMLQEPFEIHKPKNRKNFLSYSYVIYKSLQLLNRDDLLPYFSLLKSREKLQIQDQIWAKICTHLQWQFIKSI